MVARIVSLLFAGALLIAFAHPLPAHATSVLKVDVSTHLLDSTAVIEGVVGRASLGRDGETGKPFTDTGITVERVLWGTAPKALSVRQHKGTLGDMHFAIPGDGELTEGQRVVLFVVQGGGQFWLAALGQSVFELAGTGKDAALSQQIDGLTFFTRDESGAVVPLEHAVPGPRTLGELEAALSAAGEGR